MLVRLIKFIVKTIFHPLNCISTEFSCQLRVLLQPLCNIPPTELPIYCNIGLTPAVYFCII